ncbi:putative alkbh6 protein [Botrytis fragariae]|uniref:Putative alkbh6 protein n=1 Tax=Botrytis fragariae TaxID=1964551 RepID=A0A8H6AKX8_9HELO|nr:putative alkbh6 protein [Botrytis fragariae]KAF5869618.1 putative alkbh6 protein [Botrytis fragariae]
MGSTNPLPTPDPQDPSIQHWENGLVLYSNFITAEEESEIIASIQKDDRWCGIGKRQTMHYGAHFDYTTFCASETWTDVPDWIEQLVGRLPFREEGGVDQFTVQYYPPGTGIPPHVDTHSAFGEYLYSLSLGSAVPIGFKRCGINEERKMRRPKRSLGEAIANGRREKAEEDGEEKWEVWLRERSLLVMRGEARYGFAHGIRGRKFDVDVELDENGEGVKRRREGRWSITMRSVKRGAEMGCECAFPGVCDARIREERERGEKEEEKKKEREIREKGECIPEITPR